MIHSRFKASMKRRRIIVRIAALVAFLIFSAAAPASAAVVPSSGSGGEDFADGRAERSAAGSVRIGSVDAAITIRDNIEVTQLPDGRYQTSVSGFASVVVPFDGATSQGPTFFNNKTVFTCESEDGSPVSVSMRRATVEGNTATITSFRKTSRADIFRDKRSSNGYLRGSGRDFVCLSSTPDVILTNTSTSTIDHGQQPTVDVSASWDSRDE